MGQQPLPSRAPAAQAGIQAVIIPWDTEQPARGTIVRHIPGDPLGLLLGAGGTGIRLPRIDAVLRCTGDEEQPLNIRATDLVRAHRWPATGLPLIRGTALLVGRRLPGKGHLTSVPAPMRDLLVQGKQCRAQVSTSQAPERWLGNAMEFDDWGQAYRYGVRLAGRWRRVQKIRVVPAETGHPTT
ncbi:hypothetical protein KIH74_28735 [Kineosporia sp. J2-2]|uniref:Uncharacterized protein n=1 Tax=Kineosporia corallincola TaxID=2835133 RepID=A0ABS5TQT1_9ACTN|nr:hypothetical protein [Kineosporia corallincola]MBT0772964.1 hypothetical protein [Kineosporia corallincola]